MFASQIREAGKIKHLLATPRNIVITTHHKPDADALGSSLGLLRFLQKLQHTVKVVVPSDYPRFLNWMPGQGDVLIFEPKMPEPAKAYIDDAELIFCLDFNSLSRVNDMESLVRNAAATKIIVDHHLEPEQFADIWYWDNKASATCELIYELIIELGHKDLLDKAIGECLYAGIMTDTGSFRFPSTTSKVHHIIADLIDLGVNNSKLHQAVYDTNTEQRLRFLGFALSQRLKIVKEYHTAYFLITSNDLERFDSQTGDTEGLVNYALSLENINFAALIVERTEMVKMSFRSKGDFSVRDFASSHFEGGGHKNASGGKSNLSLLDTEKKFLNVLDLYRNSLNQSQ